MIKGYANEYNFCEIFHDKFINQIEEKYVNFLEDIYDKKLDPKSYVICWKSNANDKTDIIIRVGSEKKYISIKSGKNNSVHLESLDSFTAFLEELNCPKDIIAVYKAYHIGNDTNGNRLSGKEYQEKYSYDLEKLNKFLNQEKIVEKAINRFLFDGRDDFNNKVDVLIYGTPDNFKYAKKEQITKYLLSQNDIFITPHFSSLVLQPWARNLNYNPKHEYRREFVQVKWYRLDLVFEKIHLY